MSSSPLCQLASGGKTRSMDQTQLLSHQKVAEGLVLGRCRCPPEGEDVSNSFGVAERIEMAADGEWSRSAGVGPADVCHYVQIASSIGIRITGSSLETASKFTAAAILNTGRSPML